MIGRRAFLLMGTAIGGMAAIGAAGSTYVAVDRYEGWIHKILQRSLPGYSFEPEGLATFIDEYNARQGRSIKYRLFAAAEGLVDSKAMLPDRQEAHVVERERKILSDFLLGSDFFENYPNGSKTITYRGKPVACVSPFAAFD
jgi:hypothetical protein